jgi:hypothetical protein
MDIKIAFSEKEINLSGGILLMKLMLYRMEFDICLDGLPLPVQGSNYDRAFSRPAYQAVIESIFLDKRLKTALSN